MSELRICLLGPLEVYCGESQLPAFPTQKSRNLFAYLALHRDRFWDRETLASLLWEDNSPQSARKCLRTELWRIRTVLQAANGNVSQLAFRQGSVGLLTSGIWLDVGEFETRVKNLARSGSSMSEAEREQLDDCIQLYRGDFLEGCYEDWAVAARERFKNQLIAALNQLIAHHRTRGEWSTAMVYAKQALEYDPFLEHVHRELMLCYWKIGQRAAALKQHTSYAEFLQKELGVEPMHETLELYTQIKLAKGESTRPAEPSRPETPLGSVAQLLTRLNVVQDHLRELESAVREVAAQVREIAPQEVE